MSSVDQTPDLGEEPHVEPDPGLFVMCTGEEVSHIISASEDGDKDSDVYEVEDILAHKGHEADRKYQVK